MLLMLFIVVTIVKIEVLNFVVVIHEANVPIAAVFRDSGTDPHLSGITQVDWIGNVARLSSLPRGKNTMGKVVTA
jgi:hypothetical protein